MDADITREELEAAIKNTKNTAPGPDDFKYEIFKKLNSCNLTFLLKFYNIIWRSNSRPLSWNTSKVIPVPKTSDVVTPKDTRPINLINTKTKLFDKIVNNRLIYILENNKLLDAQQYGFRKNRQTLSSMLILNTDIIKAFEDKSHI